MGTLLVTGGGGFVLSRLARAWGERGPGNRVLVLDSQPLDGSAGAFLAPLGARLAVVQGSVAEAATWEALACHPWGGEITHMVHGAAVTSIDRLRRAGGFAATVPAIETNVTGTARALGFAEGLAGLRRFVCVSSGSVYADHARLAAGQPMPEDGDVGPTGLYGVTKLLGEMLTRQAAADCALPAVSVRLSGVYGPLDRETPSREVVCAPRRMLHLHKAGEAVRIANPGAVGDYIHAGDVAAALVALLTCARPRHPVYNIALGEYVSLGALARTLAEVVEGFRFEETGPEMAHITGDLRYTGARWGAYDVSRMAADTGWRPRPLAEGLADYAGWLSQNPW